MSRAGVLLSLSLAAVWLAACAPVIAVQSGAPSEWRLGPLVVPPPAPPRSDDVKCVVETRQHQRRHVILHYWRQRTYYGDDLAGAIADQPPLAALARRAYREDLALTPLLLTGHALLGAGMLTTVVASGAGDQNGPSEPALGIGLGMLAVGLTADLTALVLSLRGARDRRRALDGYNAWARLHGCRDPL